MLLFFDWHTNSLFDVTKEKTIEMTSDVITNKQVWMKRNEKK